MAILEIRELSFRYAAGERTVLDRITLDVEQGEFVLLCGTSGCGKTTLLRHIKKELEPVGVRSGEVLFQGRPLGSLEARPLARQIGMVQQSPENQTVTDRVLPELVFAMENVGFEPDLMRRRAAELSNYFGLDPLLDKHVFELSGGQKQLVQLASVLALQPRLLLLDEPTAQLDPLAARELIRLLQRINQDLGLTIVMAEHRFEELLPVADRVVVMDEGSIRHVGTPREAVRAMWSDGDRKWKHFVPPVPRFFLQLAEEGPAGDSLPLTVKEGRQLLSRMPAFGAIAGSAGAATSKADALLSAGRSAGSSAGAPALGMNTAASSAGAPSMPASARSADSASGAAPAPDANLATAGSKAVNASPGAAEKSFAGGLAAGLSSGANPAGDGRSQPLVLLECRDLVLQYTPRDAAPVLKNASLRVCRGEVLAILGANGSGKTTLLKALAGVLKPQKGKLLLDGKELGKWKAHERAARIGFLDQNPLTFFIEETVEMELRQAAGRGRERLEAAGIAGDAVDGMPGTAAAPNLGVSRTSSVAEIASAFGLSHALDRHPCDLSAGEQQLAALAAVLLAGPELLLLDEPTKGLDPEAKRRWGERLSELRRMGRTVVMVTHDVEFAAEHATRCAMMFNGAIAAEGAPASFFRDNLYYTTAMTQLLGEQWGGGIAPQRPEECI